MQIIHFPQGSIFHPFRDSPFIQSPALVKLGLRKENRRSPSGKRPAFRKMIKGEIYDEQFQQQSAEHSPGP